MIKDGEPRRIGVNVLSLNTLNNKATREAGPLIEALDAHVFLGQETGATLPDGSPLPTSLGRLKLVAHIVFSNQVNGLAIWADTDRWDIDSVSSQPLPPTRGTEFLGINPRGNRLLMARLSPRRKGDTPLVVATGHEANPIASKDGRFRQFVKGGKLTEAAAMEHGSPAIKVDDSNLPNLTGEEIGILERETGLRYVGPKNGEPTYKEYHPRVVDRIAQRIPRYRGKTFDRGMVTPDLFEGATYEVLPADSTSSDHIPVVFSI